MSEIALLVADLTPAGTRGTAIGLHATIKGAGLLPASLIAGLLWNFAGAPAPFMLGGVTGCGAAAATAIFLRRGTSVPPPAL